ncbi:MAG: hypothetical protein KIS87_03680 [Phycisphaeraceae bacterium]|nr:hypothetical protein [Phycisphaeraceae bacterium]
MRLPTLFVSLTVVLLVGGFARAQEGLTPGPEVRYDGQKVVRVHPGTALELSATLNVATTVWSERVGVGPIDIVVTADALDTLRALGLEPVTLVEDVQALIDAERAEIERRRTLRDLSWFENYKTNGEYLAYYNSLAAEFAGLASVSTIGQSLQGRPIIALRINGTGGQTPKPQIIFNGCQHAREWVSPMTVTYIADQLLRQYGVDSRVTDLMDRFEFLIVPIVNPDGYEYSWSTDRMWRKNRRQNSGGTWGVDLNRNWDVNWGGEGSSGNGNNETYRGTAPFSEPESQVVRDFILSQPFARAHIDFHSYSQLILYPWGFTTATPPEPDNSRFVTMGAEMAEAIKTVHGKTYVPQHAIELYAASGTMADWTYTVGLYGFTVELRPTGNPGFILPPEEIIPTAEENFAAILTLGEWVRDLSPYITLPDGAPEVVQAGEPLVLRARIVPGGGILTEGTPTLWTRVGGGAFTAWPLDALGAHMYEGRLPAVDCGRTVEFYLTAALTDGTIVAYPPDGSSDPLSAEAIQIVFADDFDADRGWTVGVPDDNAVRGIWGRMAPQQTTSGGHVVQPGWVVVGQNCYVTDGRAGSSAGAWDVDNGKTTLLSPILDLSGAHDPVISYWRWFSNHAGSGAYNDVFVVDVSADGGATWTNFETVGPTGAEVEGGWYFVQRRLSEVVAPTSAVRVRFVASDYDPQSLVEACIDDFRVLSRCPVRPGDYNGDTVVDTLDFLAFLNDWANGNPKADWNGDGEVNTIDFIAFLNDWVLG